MNLTVSTIGSSVQPIINKSELKEATTFIQTNAANIDQSIQDKFRAILLRLNSNFSTFITGLNETNEQYTFESKMGHCSLHIPYFNQKQLAAHSDIQVIEEYVPTIIKSLEERIAAYKTEIKYREFEKNLTAQIIEGHTSHFRGFGKLRSCHGMQYRLEQAENFLAKNCPLNESEALLDFQLTEDVIPFPEIKIINLTCDHPHL
ncbi:MAG: hypothetical protein LW832_10210 [Parachlamydia sp.]|jgi:hypothetical protein|nr:hypothetical protein [Parachlamydia sp.]